MKSCKCPEPRTRLEFVEVVHPSGSLRLPTRTRLAKLCQNCQGLVCWAYSEHTELALGLFAPYKEPQ